MPIEFNTPDQLVYQFYPAHNGQFQFRVRAANDAHVALTTGARDAQPIIEVFIGGWGNTKSVIRKNKQQPELTEKSTPNILSAGEYRGFWVRWSNNVITVGRENESTAFLTWTEPHLFHITHVGVSTGWGASGSWVIDDQPERQASPYWTPASAGHIPSKAIRGGQDNEPHYVARARHENALIPGKLVPSHGVTYVAWGGAEHPHDSYEVLCGGSISWLPVTGGAIPPQAFPGGETEDGEPLFVGRVKHEGSLTIGKVHGSHRTCYIPYGGKELPFTSYEILIAN